MERIGEQRAEQRQEFPDAQIVPVERVPEIEKKMPPGMDIGRVIKQDQDKRRRKIEKKKEPFLNS